MGILVLGVYIVLSPDEKKEDSDHCRNNGPDKIYGITQQHNTKYYPRAKLPEVFLKPVAKCEKTCKLIPISAIFSAGTAKAFQSGIFCWFIYGQMEHNSDIIRIFGTDGNQP